MKKRRIDKEIDRVRTNIVLSKEVFNLAVDYNLNLSAFLENKLVEYFLQRKQLSGMYCIASDKQPYTPDTQQLTTKPSRKTPGKNSELYGEVGLLRFERKSLAPKAKRMDQATLQAPAYTV